MGYHFSGDLASLFGNVAVSAFCFARVSCRLEFTRWPARPPNTLPLPVLAAAASPPAPLPLAAAAAAAAAASPPPRPSCTCAAIRIGSASRITAAFAYAATSADTPIRAKAAPFAPKTSALKQTASYACSSSNCAASATALSMCDFAVGVSELKPRPCERSGMPTESGAVICAGPASAALAKPLARTLLRRLLRGEAQLSQPAVPVERPHGCVAVASKPSLILALRRRVRGAVFNRVHVDKERVLERRLLHHDPESADAVRRLLVVRDEIERRGGRDGGHRRMHARRLHNRRKRSGSRRCESGACACTRHGVAKAHKVRAVEVANALLHDGRHRHVFVDELLVAWPAYLAVFFGSLVDHGDGGVLMRGHVRHSLHRLPVGILVLEVADVVHLVPAHEVGLRVAVCRRPVVAVVTTEAVRHEVIKKGEKAHAQIGRAAHLVERRVHLPTLLRTRAARVRNVDLRKRRDDARDGLTHKREGKDVVRQRLRGRHPLGVSKLPLK
eukprot:6209824-Pleurochrysis_carterae.AAC.3